MLFFQWELLTLCFFSCNLIEKCVDWVAYFISTFLQDMEKFTLQLFNTETKKKEPLEPVNNRHVKMYTCGPTVYNYVHIGNLRTFVFEDLLRRTIKFFGFSITHVMNITDLDDKTMQGAIEKKISLKEFTTPYLHAFKEDLKTLNIEPAEYYPLATEYMQPMIEMVQTLLDKGFAYLSADGSIYYAIQKFKRYGCLSHFHLDELMAGASERILHDEYDKDNVADFVLWKKYDPTRDGKIFWESPFGPGRPGWHLECSTMAMKLLGEQIDIHVGGIDNMFPHHENEIAQSEACTGKKFSQIWMHAEHLVVNHKKMSKSAENFYTLRDLLEKGFTGRQIRYLLLQTHYKTQLNFTFSGLEAAKNSLNRLDDFVQRLLDIQESQNQESIQEILAGTFEEFSSSLADDLNISMALAALFELVRKVNILCDEKKINKIQAEEIISLLKKFDTVLGVMHFEKSIDKISNELQMILNKRDEARRNKDWKLSDQLRDEILKKGYLIEDSPSGSRLKKRE